MGFPRWFVGLVVSDSRVRGLVSEVKRWIKIDVLILLADSVRTPIIRERSTHGLQNVHYCTHIKPRIDKA